MQSKSPKGLPEAHREASKRSSLCRLLDRAIVLLMVVILLTLSWPVGLILCQQMRPIERTGQVAPDLARSPASALPSDVQEF